MDSDACVLGGLSSLFALGVSDALFMLLLFVFQGVLLNGTSAEARFPFLVPQATSGPGPSPPSLPPLLFVDVSAGQELSQQGSRSLRNLEEVRAVHQLVVSLLRQGVKPSQIGITSLYRSQVSALREAVSGISVKPIVQQPQDAAPRTPTKRKKGATFSQPPSQDPNAVASGLGIQVSTVDAFQVSFQTSRLAGAVGRLTFFLALMLHVISVS